MTSPTDPLQDVARRRNEIPRDGLRWIAFDGVGTLLYPDPPVAVAYHRIGAQHGSKQTADEVWHRFQERYRAAENRDLADPARGDDSEGGGRLATDEARELERWRKIVLEVFDDVPNPQLCFESLYAHFGTPQAWCCHREARDVLPRLRRAGFRLALASNFDARLDCIADGLEDLAHMEIRVISSLVGHRKPSPLFYRALIDRSGARPDEILMVGDDFENDVVGARQAGLKAVHFSPSGRSPADPAVGSLLELAQRLGV